MSILIDIVPPEARKYVYSIYAFVGLVLGIAQILDAPWAATALAVYAFVGTALGLTAYANTNAASVALPTADEVGAPLNWPDEVGSADIQAASTDPEEVAEDVARKAEWGGHGE